MMTTMNTFFHILDINAPKNKAEAFQKVCDLMFVDVASKKHCLKGKLDFPRIAPGFDIQSVNCTGHRKERNFHFETNGKAIVEVVEILAKMLPEISIRYYFHSQEEDGIEFFTLPPSFWHWLKVIYSPGRPRSIWFSKE